MPRILIPLRPILGVLQIGNQFLNLSSDTSLIGTIKDTTDAEINSLLDVLEKYIQELKEVDNTTTIRALLRSEIPPAVNAYLGSSLGDALQKTPLPLAQSSSQAQSSLKAAKSLSEYELKTILFDKMDKSRSYLAHDKHQALFDTLLNSIVLDDVGKKTKRSRTKESEPSKKSSTSKESSKGKSPSKTSKSDKSVTTEEPVEELVFKMPSNDIEQTVDDVENDANQPLNDLTQIKDKDPKKDWFKQPTNPPTPDQEWNKRPVVVDQPEQPWFNNMVSAVKDSLTFDELMATLIDVSNNIKLEYNMEECFKALTVKLDWNNPEGNHCPFDLTKPLPLKGRPDRLTVAAGYFFNNNLEFLKSSDPKKKYTTSIMKTKADRYEIVGTEDMHKVYSTQRILIVVNVNVKKLHGYGHLEETMVRRADRQLYKFKEEVLSSKRRVKDLQLGVESYQKMLNLTKPQMTIPGIKFKEPYRPSFNLLGAVYEDLNKQKRVMRADELYKFSNGTLKLVRDELHHRVLNFCLGYNKEMLERQIIRNMERLVGTRELKMDYRLMTHTK
ncbi:hypothetical protein Tco_1105103 [Tanacetum coccineum]